MTPEPIIGEIFRYSTCFELDRGEPPEEAIRLALISLFQRMATALEYHDAKSIVQFPLNELCFPLSLKLESEKVLWDFQLKMILESPTTQEFLGKVIKENTK